MSCAKALRMALCLAMAATVCPTVYATTITPVSVTSSTAATDYWPASNLIDNSGLSLPVGISATHDETTPTNAWVTGQPGGQNGSDYYACGGQPPVLTFGLDRQYNVDGIAIWNYSPLVTATATAKNCAKLVTLQFGDNGQFGNPFALPTPLGKGYAGETAQIVYFGQAFLADTVRLTITDNWYDGIGTDGGGDRVGMSEVKFLAPEPTSWRLTAVGLFSLLCFALLVRRRSFVVPKSGDIY